MVAPILLLLLLAALAALVIVAVMKRAVDGALRQAREEKARSEQHVADLTEQLRALSKYQGIVDAEARAASIIGQAERSAEDVLAQARREADLLLAGAKEAQEKGASAAKDVLGRATAEAKELRQRADAVLTEARAEAGKIVEAAKKQAEEIAGEALAAAQNAKQLERTARAMKNVIEGYGDQYVIPTDGILDGLAEEFGFTEAGQRLKATRERARTMAKAGTAAACDYVEDNRKNTAKSFVLDAFNGKVDSVLADVRHDNVGTLQQKIYDAFSIVNHNGQAFRNARITPEYLEVRIEELRWAAVAQQLKQKEREEQRLIKERIREEEKAQREYERAIKESEKEEEAIRKAMEKARRDFDKAGGDQKAKYEEQLALLTEKLRLAEEKNKKALSMAQQTKAGHVYVISNIGSFGEHVYKIGMTRRLEPQDRIKELGDASVPFEFDVHALLRSDDAPALERALHKRFLHMQVNKVNPRKEFFRIGLQELREEAARIGCQATWTMTAECREYKETQSIERAMASKTFEEGAWIEKQLKEHDAAMKESVVAEDVG